MKDSNLEFLSNYLKDLEKFCHRETANVSRLQADWGKVIENPVFLELNRKTLYPPVEKFEDQYAAIMFSFLRHIVRQDPFELSASENVKVTDAQIVNSEALTSKNQLEFRVTYEFEALQTRLQFQKKAIYDLPKSAGVGWDEKALKNYWAVGRQIKCHYLASDPYSHQINSPFYQ